MTPEEEIRRSERARQLLSDDLFVEAFTTMQDALLLGIQTSALKDEVLREKICQMLISLRQTKQYLQSTMETGRFAVEQMKEKKKLWII